VRVVIASQYYRPEPVPIPGDVADWLTAEGHDVVVVTGYPNYPDGRVPDGYDARRRSAEREGAIEVHRLPLFVSHSRSAVARVRNYLSYARSARRAFDLVEGADVVYVYATQMTAAIGPAAWRSRGGPPFVLHIQDLWPDTIMAAPLLPTVVSRSAARILTPWLARTYRAASAIIGTSPGMERLLRERGVPAGKIETVLNWASDEGNADRSRDAAGLSLIYAGNIGAAQDLGTVVSAMELVRDLDVRLDVFGSGVAESQVRARIAAAGLTSVRFHGRVSPDAMHENYRTADFQLVTLRDEPVFRVTIPSKLGAGFAHGVPAITNVAGDVADLVTSFDVGITARPGDAAALAAAIRAAAALPRAERSAMRARARAVYAEQMARSTALSRIGSILSKAAAAA
jgi:colanic acid biosynthesis glycosyl transferase WcaI